MRLKVAVFGLMATFLSMSVSAQQRLPRNAVKAITAIRSANNPLITPVSSDSIGHNINGPSVIRVPSWIERPLGTYYMYFAHHAGQYIRLAYADSLHGPWTVYEPGTLKLHQAGIFRHHIASPDVHVDHHKREIRMYFHGPIKARGGQWTGVAFSKDGIEFRASEEILGLYYFRVFNWRGYYYAIDRNGQLLRSEDGITEFEKRPEGFIPGVRHTALLQSDGLLLIFHSRTWNVPERILMSTVNIEGDWAQWIRSDPIEVIRPEMDYEGIQYPMELSKSGSGMRVCQLRDPAIFEEDGQLYLFYSIAGEMGIALAELDLVFTDPER